MLRGSVTASLIGYLSLMHVKEFGQLLIEIPSLLEKISRGLYYERMKFSVNPHVCFYLSFNFDFCVSKIMHL